MLQRRNACSLLGALLIASGIPSLAMAEKAPAVEPSKWFNNKGSVTWDSLRGRLVLVEKWATW